MKTGIQSRLLLITAVVLGGFLTLTGFVLERSFRASVLSGAEQQLRLVVFSLMGALESNGNGFLVADPLPEPRLSQPESGLYAWITDATGRVSWQSPSTGSRALLLTPPQPVMAAPASIDGRQDPPTGGAALLRHPADIGLLQAGDFDFHAERGDGEDLLHLRYAVIWEDVDDTLLTFHAVIDRAPFQAVIQGFRRDLYVGLGAVTLLFALAQFLAVRWALRPLRTMALEVREMEDGQRARLSAGYPGELRGLAENLDRFVAHEERTRIRYRKAMEDLAHSLKTPLTVMRNAMEQVPDAPRQLLAEQLERMQSTVAHQVSRAAAASGPVIVGRSEPVGMLVHRLVRALQTAYQGRDIQVAIDIPEPLRVRGDERDLMEIFGNLLENAFKYAHSAIRVRAFRDGGLTVCIDDDGSGVAPALREEVLNRGTRADEVQPGQGIGLAVVAELVQLYQGRLQLEDSDLGGTRVRLQLP